MTVSPINPNSRESDERLLEWLRQRILGLTCEQIAAAAGDVTTSDVRRALSRIIRESREH